MRYPGVSSPGMLERVQARDGLVYYKSPLLAARGVRHAFSTRKGGVSPPPFDALNLGNPQGAQQDAWDNIHRNYDVLQTAIDCPAVERCWVHQIHGSDVAVARSGNVWENGQKADAIVTDDPNRLAAIRVADCVPVLLASEDGRVVAAVHAGWRGVLAGVLPNTIVAMRELGGNHFVAAIGPAISAAAFEVSRDVLDAFSQSFGDDRTIITQRHDDKGHIDLRAALLVQLREAGIADDLLDTTDLCTAGTPDEFFSHRRDAGVTGRMAALIRCRI